MKTSGTRLYAIDPVTLILVVLAIGAALPATRPWNWFHKGPAERAANEIEQVKKLEAERAAAVAKAEALQAEKEAATKKAQVHRDTQLVKAQELTFGAADSLARVANPQLEVRTAATFLQHALVYQSMALGELTLEQKKEVIRLIELAVAGKEAEFKEALAKKDAEVAQAQQDKKQALAQAETAARELGAVKTQVTSLSTNLTTALTKADTAAQTAKTKEKEANSLGTQLNRLVRWVIYAAIAYVFVVYVLPIFALAFPKLGGIGKVSGWLAAPFHQIDARKKELLAVDMVGAHEDAKVWLEKNFGAEAREKYKSEVLGQWATAKDGTAQLVAQIKDSSLLKKRSGP